MSADEIRRQWQTAELRERRRQISSFRQINTEWPRHF